MHHDSACLPVPIDLQCRRRGATRAGRRHTSCVKWRGVGMSKTPQYHTLDVFRTVANVLLLRCLFFVCEFFASSFLKRRGEVNQGLQGRVRGPDSCAELQPEGAASLQTHASPGHDKHGPVTRDQTCAPEKDDQVSEGSPRKELMCISNK